MPLEPPTGSAETLIATQRERLNAALAGRYAIERELGSGGMATVYLADDLKYQRKVAVKVLRPELASVLGPDRFLREVEIAAKLNHPHILALYDSGEAGGLLFYVMPYVKGESLRHKLERETQLPIDEALRITRQVASALGHAHDQGVIHGTSNRRTSCSTKARRWSRTSASPSRSARPRARG